jgi:hypothetical protein
VSVSSVAVTAALSATHAAVPWVRSSGTFRSWPSSVYSVRDSSFIGPACLIARTISLTTPVGTRKPPPEVIFDRARYSALTDLSRFSSSGSSSVGLLPATATPVDGGSQVVVERPPVLEAVALLQQVGEFGAPR